MEVEETEETIGGATTGGEVGKLGAARTGGGAGVE